MNINKKYEANLTFIMLVACIVSAVLFYIIYRRCSNLVELDEQSPLMSIYKMCIKRVMQTGLIGCCFLTIYNRKKKKRYQIIISCILVMGIIMRIGYMLYTPYTVRGHDVLESCGHADYIIELMSGHLPLTNDYQFYHPPLFHALAAGMALLFGKLTGIKETPVLLEAGKLISCWASIVTLGIARELCREIKLGEEGTIIAMSLMAFLPEHYLLAGRLNNDSLSTMFLAGVLLFTLRWIRTRSFIDLSILAFCYGLGIMTKVSVGSLAVVTGIVMLYVLYLNIRNGTGIICLQQYAVFALIAFPLGLWYPIRNLILFKQPFTYVYPIRLESPVYVGNYSLAARFFPSLDNYIYADPHRDYNVWPYIVRTSVFGEFTYSVPLWIPQVLLVCAGFLALVSLFAIVRVVVCTPLYNVRMNILARKDQLLVACWGVTLIFYIWFNIQYPFGCTMDFRYLVPTAIIGSLLIGRWADSRGKGIIQEYASYSLWILIGLFSLVSCLMYTMI